MQDILRIIGIKQIGEKFKETKSIKDVNLDSMDSKHPLYLLRKSLMLKSCFPITHFMMTANAKLAKQAYEGKGLYDYANEVEALSQSSTKIITPMSEAVDNDELYSLYSLNDADFSGSCIHANNCPLLKIIPNEIIGKPCPILIEMFLKNVTYFSKVTISQINQSMDLTSSNKRIKISTISEISDENKETIIKAACMETRSEYNVTFDSENLTIGFEKGNLVSKYNASSMFAQANNRSPSKILDIFKNGGLDIGLLQKATTDLLLFSNKELAKLKLQKDGMKKPKDEHNIFSTINLRSLSDVKANKNKNGDNGDGN